MVLVRLWGSLKARAGGRTELEVEAVNIRELLNRLGEDQPGLRDVLEKGVSISVDGRIYNDDWYQPIAADSEVYILPRIEGG